MTSKNSPRKERWVSEMSCILQRQKMNTLSVLIENQDNLTPEDRKHITHPYGR